MSEQYSFNYSGFSELEVLEKCVRNYNHFIVKKFINHLSNSDGTVLDFGAGIGTLAKIFSELRNDLEIYCYELDVKQLEIIKQRGLKTVSKLGFEALFDYVYTSNVLEHIENDIQALCQINSVITPNGKIGIYVPANKYLYSHIDKKLEHFRRYSKKELIRKVENSGFTVENCYYADSLGLFAWLFFKIFRIRIDSPGSHLLSIYDQLIWPISRFLDNLGLKYLFGKNLVLLASKN
jgi:SAM-dependent methyltransferase